jgi:hypothetical protein
MAMNGIAGKCARAVIVATGALALGWAFAGSTAVSAASIRAPQKAQKVALTNISCSSTKHCIAIGRIGTAAFPPSLAEAWNGSHWRRIASPGVQGPVGLDCLGSAFCVVGGNDTSAGRTDTSIFNGQSWKVTPSAEVPSFNKLTCVNKKFCVTVGFGGDVLHWDGSAWQTFKNVPEPAGETNFGLSGVSCSSVKFCLAVGFATTDGDAQIEQAVAEMWNGTSWRLVSPPAHNLESIFNDVSCTGPTHCMAVGSLITPKKKPGTFSAVNIAAQWDGSTWHVTHLPGKVGVGFGDDRAELGLGTVACPTATSCMAVGNFGARAADDFGGIAIAWNGTKWQVTKLAGTVSTLNDVSCPAASDCIAVGRSGNHTMAQRWNGKSWSLLSTP